MISSDANGLTRSTLSWTSDTMHFGHSGSRSTKTTAARNRYCLFAVLQNILYTCNRAIGHQTANFLPPLCLLPRLSFCSCSGNSITSRRLEKDHSLTALRCLEYWTPNGASQLKFVRQKLIIALSFPAASVTRASRRVTVVTKRSAGRGRGIEPPSTNERTGAIVKLIVHLFEGDRPILAESNCRQRRRVRPRSILAGGGLQQHQQQQQVLARSRFSK